MNAICRLGIVPIRANPSDSSEMISQMIYGERCYILKKQGIWSHIESQFDGYKGWVDSLQVSVFNGAERLDHVVSAPFIELNGQYLPMGSELTASEAADAACTGIDIVSIGSVMTPQSMVAQADRFLKSPYLWGGRTVFGVDCSGLTQTIYKIGGYQIPRDSGVQEKCGNPVQFDKAKSGDLAFFCKPGKKKISHVGIVSVENSNIRIIHASSWVKKDQLTPNGIINDSGALTHELVSIKRIIPLESGSV